MCVATDDVCVATDADSEHTSLRVSTQSRRTLVWNAASLTGYLAHW